jgi:hypothetical protein
LPLYQNMVNLTGFFHQMSKQIYEGYDVEHCTSTVRFLGLAKFTTHIPLSLLILCFALLIVIYYYYHYYSMIIPML